MSLYVALAEAIEAERRARDMARPEFTGALDLDWYDAPDRRKPLLDRRYCVAQFVWRGGSWRRMRKTSGPLQFTAGLAELTRQLKRGSLPHVRDA